MLENNINQLVKNLPEIYQRIYGHSEFDDTSRLCSDREKYITCVVENLQDKLGKKDLKILDIGCAQGYFSLSLASKGCKVTGLDYCKENIELCRALNKENNFDCKFDIEKLTSEFVENIEDDEFDVILILSVIHHVCNEGGFDYARGIFEKLAQKSKILITELAVKGEPLYWNKNLPTDYDSWFDNIKFFDELTFFPTHLAEISRPLIICSDKYFYCENRFFEFSEYKTHAYDLKPTDLSRRYFLNDNMLMKLYRGRNEVVFNEIENEKTICEKYNFSFAPKLLSFQKENRSMLAVYEIKKGDKLLVDAVKNNEKLDFEKIFLDILENLIELEKNNLFPGDLRSWNVCLKNNEAFLIDFGDFKEARDDLVANIFNKTLNFTVYDSFITLIYDCLTGNYYRTIKDFGIYSLTAFYDESKLENKYLNFFKSYFLFDKKDISFSEIKTLFKRLVIEENEVSFSQEENIKYLSKLQNRLYKQKVDYVDLKIQELKLNTIENNQIYQNSEVNKKFLQTVNRLAETENRLSQQIALNEKLQKRLDELNGLILNTRHRTLYGACAWLFRKIFRRK